MTKIRTVEELIAAYAHGHLSADTDQLLLDNDSTYIYDRHDMQVFEMHPNDLLRALLDHLGIPWEEI